MNLFWRFTSVLSVFFSLVLSPFKAFAEYTYTPLLTAAMFDGPKADTLLAVNGMLLFVFIVLGLGLIVGVLKR